MGARFSPSAEIRWFYINSGTLWDDVRSWFVHPLAFPFGAAHDDGIQSLAQDCILKLERDRTDQYLVLPDCDSMGIKQRQGKLEVKTLVSAPRTLSLPQGTGRADQWLKWSFEPSKSLTNPLDSELSASGTWRKVTKWRCVQKWSLDSASPIAVSPDDHPTNGCNIEVTRLEIDGLQDQWVTIGFEAFQQSRRVLGFLDEVIKEFFKLRGKAPVQLRGCDSLNYPAWLAQLE